MISQTMHDGLSSKTVRDQTRYVDRTAFFLTLAAAIIFCAGLFFGRATDSGSLVRLMPHIQAEHELYGRFGKPNFHY